MVGLRRMYIEGSNAGARYVHVHAAAKLIRFLAFSRQQQCQLGQASHAIKGNVVHVGSANAKYMYVYLEVHVRSCSHSSEARPN